MQAFRRRVANGLLKQSAIGSSVASSEGCVASFSTHSAAATSWGADGKIKPHGQESLVNLMVKEQDEAAKLASACNYKIELNERQACDVELLTVGGFTPLDGFMNEDAYESVVDKMRLPNGLLFGLPVVMDTRNDAIKPGSKILMTFKGKDIAVMDVE